MPASTRVPRVVGLLFLVAVLYGLNQVAPRILPAILGLLVLYAAVTNVGRAEALIGSIDASLGGLIQPAYHKPLPPGHTS